MFIQVCSLLITWGSPSPLPPAAPVGEAFMGQGGHRNCSMSLTRVKPAGPVRPVSVSSTYCPPCPPPVPGHQAWGKAASLCKFTPSPLTWPQALSLGLCCRPLFQASPSSPGMDLRFHLSSLGLLTKGPSSGFLSAFSSPVLVSLLCLLLWLRFLCVPHLTGNIQIG